MTNIDRYHLVIVGDGSCGKTSILTVFRVSEFLGTGLHLLLSLISGTKVTRIIRFINDCFRRFKIGFVSDFRTKHFQMNMCPQSLKQHAVKWNWTKTPPSNLLYGIQPDKKIMTS